MTDTRHTDTRSDPESRTGGGETVLQQRLRQRLAEAGRTGRSVSRAVGDNHSLVSDILTGKTDSPRDRTLHAVARELGTTADWLTGRTDDPAAGRITVEGAPAPAATPAERLRAARRAAGHASAADFAAARGIPAGSYTPYESGALDLTAEAAADFAGALGVDRAWLLHGAGEGPAATGRQPPPRRSARAIGPQHATGGRDLPLLGFAQAGAEGAFYDQGNVMAYVERPPQLLGVPDAYAVLCWDDSMEPRAFHGEVLQVNPHKPAMAGDFVVLQFSDGRALFKRLQRRTAALVVVSQLNPPADIEFPAAEISEIHLVVGSAWFPH